MVGVKDRKYHRGAEARKSFEEGMKKLFRVPKSAAIKKTEPKESPKPKRENEN